MTPDPTSKQFAIFLLAMLVVSFACGYAGSAFGKICYWILVDWRARRRGRSLASRKPERTT